MRRLIGAVMMLAGAYALYWAWQGASGHMPNFAFNDPVTQYGVGGALLVIAGIAVFRSYRPPLKNTMECPSCGKTLQKGRRNCPFCKEELVKY
jgi:hypothetical protein